MKMRNLSNEKSPDYTPTAWHRFDRDGNPLPVCIFASRSYDEWRHPNGRVSVELHRPMSNRTAN